jgi:hypothetical protein
MINSLGQTINNSHETIRHDILSLIPNEISVEILSYLNQQELTGASKVNKQWKVLADTDSLWNELYLRDNLKKAFTKKDWNNFGDIGEEPPLPKGIINILKGPCPFSPGKTVGETHRLVLIPETMNDKPLTFAAFNKARQHSKDNYPYMHLPDNCNFLKKYGEESTGHAHWIFLTDGEIKESLVQERIKNQGTTQISQNKPEMAICFTIKNREYPVRVLHLNHTQLAGMNCYTLISSDT